MKRRQARETTVYSTSAIDLFCSALGVFMVVFFMYTAIKGRYTEMPFTPDEQVGTAAAGKASELTAKDRMLMFVIKWMRVDSPDIDLVVQTTDLCGNDLEWNYYKLGTQGSKIQAGGFVADDLGAKDGHDSEMSREVWAVAHPRDGFYNFYVRQYGHRAKNQAVPVIGWRVYTDTEAGIDCRYSDTVDVKVANEYANISPANLQFICTVQIKDGKFMGVDTTHPNLRNQTKQKKA